MPNPPDAPRANSYDNAWQSGWIAHCRSVYTASGKTNGFALQIGDSMTHAFPYALWPLQGSGKTAQDDAVINYFHGTDSPGSNTDTTSKNGWYLAFADTTASRGMTAASDIGAGELLAGSGLSGPDMPSDTGPTAAATLTSATYPANLRLDTLIAAFRDARFAVVMLNINSVDPSDVTLTGQIVDALEAQNIVVILSTIPPRTDPTYNAMILTYNQALRNLAQSRGLPLIDFYQEILLRRPGTSWDGTLIGTNDIHPTAGVNGYSSDSDPYLPGGDPGTLTTGTACLNSGYLLRSWLTVQKLHEVKQYVVDGVTFPPTFFFRGTAGRWITGWPGL